MKLYGVTEPQLQECLRAANAKYNGNLQFNYTTQKSTHVQFTMRVGNSRGPGARLSHSGRHIVAACWHAHRDLMREIFNKYPNARLITARARYIGKQGFEDNYEGTGYANIGSMFQPMSYAAACGCGY